nr:hypothetical protein CFP56_32343 [Quercus suber]
MTAFAILGGKRSRLFPLAGLSLFSIIACFLLFTHYHTARRKANIYAAPSRVDPQPALEKDVPRTACIGPRGKPLSVAHGDDLPRAAQELQNVTFPDPTVGSYELLGLEKSWLTIEERYGPYGYGDESGRAGRSKVEWEKTDWGKLQADCVTANEGRFHLQSKDGSSAGKNEPMRKSKLRLFDQAQEGSPKVKSGRQAIVLRTWSTYDYTPEDYFNIRAIITEASLATSGEYHVFLLVDVKDEDGHLIHSDEEVYQRVLDSSIPLEFRSIAVLFHESLQRSWYEKVDEFRYVFLPLHDTLLMINSIFSPVMQIMQPLQLFAHFYSEFDHYWQFEMDTRFMSHTGSMLQAFHSFSTAQPYKQSRERSSWIYIPQLHGTYEEFSQKISQSLDGGATVWGPVLIDEVEPIGPIPPVKDAKDDNFEWGVDWEADLVLLGQLNIVNRFEKHADWVFRDLTGNIKEDSPRFMSVPAQARASYDLLEAAHRAQHAIGIRVPAEATLPSFALWNGLKVVSVPLPKYQFPGRNIDELNFILNGGGLEDFQDGIANGPGQYRSSSTAFFTRPMTWDWTSSLNDPVFEHWAQKEDARGDLPPFMAKYDGKVYVPGFLMHPRKTNNYVS